MRNILIGYGLHPWLKIRVNQQTKGYVFGALVDFDIDLNQQIKKDASAYIREENVNVRACPRLHNSVSLVSIG